MRSKRNSSRDLSYTRSSKRKTAGNDRGNVDDGACSDSSLLARGVRRTKRSLYVSLARPASPVTREGSVTDAGLSDTVTMNVLQPERIVTVSLEIGETLSCTGRARLVRFASPPLVVATVRINGRNLRRRPCKHRTR